MKNKFTPRSLFLLPLLAIVLSSCVQRNLELVPNYSDGTLELTPLWPDGLQPAGAQLLIYNAAGEFISKHEIMGSQTMFSCPLKEGEYQFIVHNTDGENVYFYNSDKYASVSVYAFKGDIPRQGSELLQPHNIYSIGKHDLGQTLAIKANQVNSFTARAERCTHQIVFRFAVSGLENIAGVTGQLVGVAPGILLSSGSALSIPCFQSYVANKSKAAGLVSTRADDTKVAYDVKLEFFDLIARTNMHDGGSTVLTTDIADGDGKVYQVTTDITTIVQDVIQGNGGVMPIEIPLEVTFDINKTTGNFTSSVDLWDITGSGGGNINYNEGAIK